jgi:alkylmercury lyase-like protein
MPESIDTQVRVELFREFVQSGRAPSADRIAELMGMPEEEIRSALERLASGKAIVLQPYSRELLMAAPLYAVPTPYLVRVGNRSFFGACIWDALGIIAMLRTDGLVETSCPCCGEAMRIPVRDNRPAPVNGVIHFALPAKRWWENIVFT